MKRRTRKIWIWVMSVFFTLFVLLPVVAVGIVKWFILPPEKLTPIVLNYVKPLVNGQVEIDRIELTFWNTFPRVGLNLTGGHIVSYACKDSLALATGETAMSDTLVSFSNATVSVHVMDYLRRNRVTVEKLVLDEPYFYGLIDEQGRMNWDVTWPSEEEDEDGEPSEIPLIDLQQVGIRNGHFIYEDRPGNMYTEVAGFNLRMRNKMRKGNLNVDIKTGFASLIFDSPAYTLENDLAVNFESKLDLYRGRVSFEDAKLELNGHPFSAEGEVQREGQNLLLDIMFGMKVENLADLLAFVPDEYLQNKKKITTKGSLSVEGKIDGILGDSSAPNIRMLCMLDKAALKMKGSNHGIEKLDAEVGMFLNGNYPDSSVVSFRKLDMEGTNTSFSANGRVSQLVTDPYIDAKLKGRIDFGGMLEDIINPDSFVVKGTVEADIEAAFRLWELMDADLTRLNAAGKFNIDRLIVADKAAGMSVFAKGLYFSADTTTQQSSFLTNSDLVSAVLTVDTMSIRYGTDINTRFGKLDVSAKTSRTIDTTTVVPVSTHIKVENMLARLPDSVWVSGHNIYLRGGIKASDSDRKKGVFGGIITADTVRYTDIPARTRGVLLASSFNLSMMPLRDAMRQQRAQAARRTAGAEGDSVSARPAREPGALRNRQESTEPNRRSERTVADASTEGGRRPARGQTDTVAAAIETGERPGSPVRERTPDRPRTADGGTYGSRSESGSQSGGILRNWEIKGSVQFESMRMFTGLFPLPLVMRNTTLKFDTDKVNLSNARLRVGKSDFLLNGEVNSMRRALLAGGVFRGNLSVSSDHIDLNQLMRALNQSVLMAEAPREAVQDEESLVGAMVESMETAGETELYPSDEEPEDAGLFVVPANVDLVLNLNARKVDFEDVSLENINGEIVVRNQSVNLRKLNMTSEVGSGNVTMVYTAKDSEKATAAFELEMEDIIVERLIGMFPSIDSLLPMLRSFEGVLDCQITAMCEIDSMMNVVLPTLETACYLTGENMVLMDGETFAEISKKLMFKNKDRNLIDYISVDLHIKDNKVEIYPFKVDMDRYKLAVGGVHNLDMTFDYHVSVLKSPVPFKLGIDIKGNLDDFKFKIVKCRYKQLFKVAREEELQETRINLRSSIRESIASHLAANAPELRGGYTQERIRSRRPETAVTDMDEDDDAFDESAVEDGEEGEEVTVSGSDGAAVEGDGTDGVEVEQEPDAGLESGTAVQTIEGVEATEDAVDGGGE